MIHVREMSRKGKSIEAESSSLVVAWGWSWGWEWELIANGIWGL